MNLQNNIETYISIISILSTTIALILIIKINWKQYGLLFLLGSIVGELLCYFFVQSGFYYYPYRLFPHLSPMPVFAILTVFPAYILIGVRYSPESWPFKIPFYWAFVHLGVTLEVLFKTYTKLIKYGTFWNTWDSYTWWWLYLLVFEWIGGVIVSKEYRKPISRNFFRYGKLGWFLLHMILISTILLAGLYLGIRLSHS